MLEHFFPLLFPKDSESLKILDIRLREVRAKRRLNGTSKVNTQTDRQTDRQTDGQIDLKKASAQRADALKIILWEEIPYLGFESLQLALLCFNQRRTVSNMLQMSIRTDNDVNNAVHKAFRHTFVQFFIHLKTLGYRLVILRPVCVTSQPVLHHGPYTGFNVRSDPQHTEELVELSVHMYALRPRCTIQHNGALCAAARQCT